MVILITGASHTGKTLLAHRMLESFKYPYLSIDHLKMGLIRSGNTSLTPLDDDALTEYLWPIVRCFPCQNDLCGNYGVVVNTPTLPERVYVSGIHDCQSCFA